MKKCSKGYLTVEATITLTVFLFMMMFLMNMGQIYRAQNYVTHSLLQSGKMLSFSSYAYKQISAVDTIGKLVKMLQLCEIGDDGEIELYWRTAQYEKAVKRAFGYCAGENPEQTDAVLKQYGLKNGMDSLTFKTVTASKDLNIVVEYQIELPFAFFGFDHITMHQQVKCGLWS